jgi:hypothetical protein
MYEEKTLSEKVGEWFIVLGFAFLGILIILISMADLDASEVKDTRITSQGKSFMTYFKTCIETCKIFEERGHACLCQPYSQEQMKLFKGDVK